MYQNILLFLVYVAALDLMVRFLHIEATHSAWLSISNSHFKQIGDLYDAAYYAKDDSVMQDNLRKVGIARRAYQMYCKTIWGY